jgi:hypothetical protein
MTEGNKKRNKNEVEEPRFQMNKFKLEKKNRSDSGRMRGKGIDRERSLVLIIRS